jgi:hypothetical protein
MGIARREGTLNREDFVCCGKPCGNNDFQEVTSEASILGLPMRSSRHCSELT